MKSSEIKKVVSVRPFEPVELRLVDGDRHVVPHPETILVGDDLVALLDEGRVVLVAPEAVVSIRKVTSGRSPRRK